MSIKKLTQKQYSFMNNYVQNGFNATQAARDAGYSQKYADAKAYDLVNHPAISERISVACQKATETTEITFQWKIEKLKQVISSCENSPLAQDKRVVIEAISELNKMQGDYAPDKRMSMTIDATKERLAEVRRLYENETPRKYAEY